MEVGDIVSLRSCAFAFSSTGRNLATRKARIGHSLDHPIAPKMALIDAVVNVVVVHVVAVHGQLVKVLLG